MRIGILSPVGFILLLLCVGAGRCDESGDDDASSTDLREGKAYFTVLVSDVTPSGVDAMSQATPGADIDAVAVVKAGGETVYANKVESSSLGLTTPYPGLENPDLALGTPDWPDGTCVAGEVRFFGMAGQGGYVLVSFPRIEIEAGDTIRVFECENGPFHDEAYSVSVGASADPDSSSFVEIATDQAGIQDFTVPELPAL